VTDANLVLGLLDAGTPLAGGVALDAGAARRAIASLGSRTPPDEQAARGVIRVADAEMVRALRVMTVEQGLDPRDFALLAFGGAGGLHAVAIAEELGMTRVLVPRASGVLSALGLAAADRRVDVQRSVLGRPYDLDALAAEARERLRRDDAAIEVAYDCRYRGQSFELTVADPADFEAAHEDRYGFREEDGVVDVVTVASPRGSRAGGRARRPGRPARRAHHARHGVGPRHRRPARRPARGHHGGRPGGRRAARSTVAVPSGWRGRVDDSARSSWGAA
jgi:N-methylhydantoinase A/oxoprolinase/acetone carboxylase beta subunit